MCRAALLEFGPSSLAELEPLQLPFQIGRLVFSFAKDLKDARVAGDLPESVLVRGNELYNGSRAIVGRLPRVFLEKVRLARYRRELGALRIRIGPPPTIGTTQTMRARRFA
jgi:hypothetical protein